ncbi:MAG: peptide deformylase [Alphaproteobacteria bacterium]|nr:peptide deformylase [Alphaproteobacteria bacterium]
MSKFYDVVIAPAPVLKQTAQPVDRVDVDIQAQMDKMLATMYEAPGIGLAANQVGLLNRVLVLDIPENSWKYGEEKNGVIEVLSSYRSGGENNNPEPPIKNSIIMANPEVIWSSEQHSTFDEGCLSVPEQYAIIERPAKVRIKYLDYDGKEQEIDAEGLFSHALQHEIDHLNGHLFIDYLSSLKRNMILRKVDKIKKQQLL